MSVARRVIGLDAARAKHGAFADQVAALYQEADPDPPASPTRLAPVPRWLDLERCNRGGRTLRRFGLLGTAVLRCYALPLSYLSPHGIRPLTATANLVEHAGPRLYRTAHYVIATYQENALVPRAQGWRLAASVRYGHQQVRERLLRGGWDTADGLPIPQPDLAATALLFGPLTVHGLRLLGAEIKEEEADDVAHLSRAMAHGQGVLPQLQADTHAHSLALFETLTCMNGPANAASKTLMASLLDVPKSLARTPTDRAIAPPLCRIYKSIATHLLTPEVAHHLGVHSLGRSGRLLGSLTKCMPRHSLARALHDKSVQWVIARGRRKIDL